MVETRSRTSRAASGTTSKTTTSIAARPSATATKTPSSRSTAAANTSTSSGAARTLLTSSASSRRAAASANSSTSKTSAGRYSGPSSRVPARSSTTSTRQSASTLANQTPAQSSASAAKAPASRSQAHASQQSQQPNSTADTQPRRSESQLTRLSHSTPAAAGVGSSSGTAHPYNTRKTSAVHTVNELIAGKIQEVYVLEDDEDGADPPPPPNSLSQHHTHYSNHHHPSSNGNVGGQGGTNSHQPYLPPIHAPPGSHHHHLQHHSSRPPLAPEYSLHYGNSRTQPAGVTLPAGSSGYRPSPRLNGSVLRGASTASGRGSALPPPNSHYLSASSPVYPVPPSSATSSTGGVAKGKRKAQDEQYYSNTSVGGGAGGGSSSSYNAHLLAMQGHGYHHSHHPHSQHHASPARSTSSSNRYSQSVGVPSGGAGIHHASHGALDRAMQAQHRAAAAAAAAGGAGDGSTTSSHYHASGGVSGDGTNSHHWNGPADSVAKRRRRDADGNFLPSGAGTSIYHPIAPPPLPPPSNSRTATQQHAAATTSSSSRYVKSGKVGSQADYTIISSRHAAPAAGVGYHATPPHYAPVASTSGAAPPASYRGGYPAGQGYVETQYDHAHAAPPAEELPCDDKEGHYIVRAGDIICSRYRIVGLLGQGTFGKVVECVDLRARRHVAVKVIRAIQKYRDASQIEIRVLKALKDHDPLNEHQCIHLIEHFTYRNHVCIVSELLGKSVFDFLKENDFAPFPSMHIWSFAKQLLKSVAFLHRLGLVHTDLKPENILLVSSDHTTVRTTATSGSGSSARRIPKVRNMLRSTEIRLIDFGSATFEHEYHSAVVSTRHYRAPEIILGMGWSFPCDAWSIGCILVEFFTGDALFQTHDNLEHLAMMEAVLGVMPDDYRRHAEQFKPELFRHGRLNFPNPDVPKQSKRYVRQMKKLQDIIGGGSSSSNSKYAKHNTRFVHLVRRLLEFDPQRRITVSDALNHPYFDLVEHEFPP